MLFFHPSKAITCTKYQYNQHSQVQAIIPLKTVLLVTSSSYAPTAQVDISDSITLRIGLDTHRIFALRLQERKFGRPSVLDRVIIEIPHLEPTALHHGRRIAFRKTRWHFCTARLSLASRELLALLHDVPSREHLALLNDVPRCGWDRSLILKGGLSRRFEDHR